MYVDVHTHLTHEAFLPDKAVVIENAKKTGLGAVIVNGLDPKSNREILELSKKYEIIKAALGIYPVQAAQDFLPEDLPYEVEKFSIPNEIKFIEEHASKGNLVAIGECGLDYYWLKENSYEQQERVLIELINIAKNNSIPLIIHSRKAEKECFELLDKHDAKKVNFHCYSGKYKLAEKYVEKPGWYFSIPCNSRRSELFAKMLRNLPLNKILTETDAPYLGPVKNERSEPKFVKDTVCHLSELRSISIELAKERIWENYNELFGK